MVQVEVAPGAIQYRCPCGLYQGTEQGLRAHRRHTQGAAECKGSPTVLVNQGALRSPDRPNVDASAGAPEAEEPESDGEVLHSEVLPAESPAAPIQEGEPVMATTRATRVNVPGWFMAAYDAFRIATAYDGNLARFILDWAARGMRDHGYGVVLVIRDPDGESLSVDVPRPHFDNDEAAAMLRSL